MRFAIFSGRFDPVHLGHLQTIVKIAGEYDHVIVPILDYPERAISAGPCKMVLEMILRNVAPINNITVVINGIHFGQMTEKKYNDFIKEHIGVAADVTYLSGNPEVLSRFAALKLKHKHIERSMDEIYTGTKIRKELLGDYL